MSPLDFSIQIERGWSKPTQILSEMYKSLQEVLQPTLELANTSIYDRVNSNMYGHVQCS